MKTFLNKILGEWGCSILITIVGMALLAFTGLAIIGFILLKYGTEINF